jgi:predicted nucleic acid-binding protein
LSKVVFLDTGILGFVTHPKANAEATDCTVWLRDLLQAGVRICVSEICDFELRREYLLNNSITALGKLDSLNANLNYIPINTTGMRRAAQLWADVRKAGQATADPKELDCDVVLAAQALLSVAPSDDMVIATTNVGHLSRFCRADVWRNISP